MRPPTADDDLAAASPVWRRTEFVTMAVVLALVLAVLGLTAHRRSAATAVRTSAGGQTPVADSDTGSVPLGGGVARGSVGTSLSHRPSTPASPSVPPSNPPAPGESPAAVTNSPASSGAPGAANDPILTTPPTSPLGVPLSVTCQAGGPAVTVQGVSLGTVTLALHNTQAASVVVDLSTLGLQSVLGVLHLNPIENNLVTIDPSSTVTLNVPLLNALAPLTVATAPLWAFTNGDLCP